MTKHTADFSSMLDSEGHWVIDGRRFTRREMQAIVKARHLQNTTYPRTFYYDTFGSPQDRRTVVASPQELCRLLDRYMREAPLAEWNLFVWEMVGADHIPAQRTVRPLKCV